MFKNMKMYKVISFWIGIISVVCLGLLYIVLSRATSATMNQAAENNMSTVLDAQANYIDQFITDSEGVLQQYAQSGELKNYLCNPDNKEYQKAAQSFSERYYSTLTGWEGIYIANWKACIVAHSSASAVGMVTRKEEELDAFHATMTESENGFFDGGIFVSPASGTLILNMRMQINDDKGNPVGYAGGGPFISELSAKLNEFKVQGLDNAVYTIIDTKNNIYVLNQDESKIIGELDTERDQKIVENIAAGQPEGFFTYREGSTKYVASYQYIENQNLALVISCPSKEIYKAGNKILNQTRICIFGAFIAILIVCLLISKKVTTPLTKVEASVNRLKDLSISDDASISNLVDTKSEMGGVATAVHSLTMKLQELVSHISGSSDTLTKNANNLNGVVDETTDKIQSISSSIHDVAEGAASQAEDTTDCMMNIQKLNSNIDSISSEIDNLSALLRTSSEVSASSKDSMNDLITVNNKTKENIDRIVQQSQENIKVAEEINVIIDVINQVTTQTNLLALNASIEAARAGEAGRGFAVVASEIGNLANDSSNATSKIKDIIFNLISQIEDTSTISAALKDNADLQVTQLTDTSARFDKVLTSINEISEVARIVEQNIDSINVIKNEINMKIDALASISEENSALASETISSAEIIETNMCEMRGVVDSLNQSIKELNEIAASFSV